MRQILFVAGAAIALAACGGSETGGTIEDEEGVERGSYTVDRMTGETTATLETEDGTLNVESGTTVRAELPDGFSLYPGGKVLSATNASMGEGQGTMVIFESDDSPKEIASHYREQAKAAGIEIEMELNTAQGRMIAGKSPEGRTISVNSNPQGDKTVTQLMVGDKFGE